MRSHTPLHLVHDLDRVALPGLIGTALVTGGRFRHSAENNSSIVIRVQIEGKRVVLTGDVEREAESLLDGRILRCDILKVAHHGSRSSSTAPFLEEARPRLAIISCGRHNLFGHPHREVLAAFEQRGVRILRTDRSGTVLVAIRGRLLYTKAEIDTSH